MCLACGFSGLLGDWTLAGLPENGMSDRRDADLRLEHLASLLQRLGVTVRASGFGSGFRVSDTTGRTIRVASIDALWPAVHRLAGTIVDPLDPFFLAQADA